MVFQFEQAVRSQVSNRSAIDIESLGAKGGFDGIQIDALIKAKSKEESFFERVFLFHFRAGKRGVGKKGVYIVRGCEANRGVRLAGMRGAEHGVGIHAETKIRVTKPVLQIVA